MPHQQLLPLIPANATRIGEKVSVLTVDGETSYFFRGGPHMVPS